MLTRNTLIVLFISTATAMVTGCGGGEQRQVIQNKGSDTLVNVAQAWAEAYQAVDPNVVVAVSGGGSGTGIAAVINGTVDIANSSRQLEEDEMHSPTITARTRSSTSLATTRWPSSRIGQSIGEISIEQPNRSTSTAAASPSGPTCRSAGCQDQEIVVVSRQNNSGAYAISAKRFWATSFRLAPRHARFRDVVDLVEKTPCAIGAAAWPMPRPRQAALCFPAARQRLRTPDRNFRGRRQLPDRPPFVHVYQRRADGTCRRLSELDQE
jgi:phosphate transport system substrate-binding protein